MRHAVDDLLARTGRVAARRALLTVLSRAELDDEIRRGHLSRVFRRTYCRPWDADLPAVRDRAAYVRRRECAYIARQACLPGRRDLSDLLRLLPAGCEGELEIWGRTSVFDVPGLRHGVAQHRLVVGRRRFRLDLAFIAERVAVEMDGESWRFTREQRERDRRRDALLASIGWLTLRFSWWRLHHDVDGCRRETLATLRSRQP